MDIKKVHYNRQEIVDILRNETFLIIDDEESIASLLDCLTFMALKQLSNAINIISKGKD